MKKIGYINQNGEICSFRVAFITLGCKVNQYETNMIQKEFEKTGFLVVHEKETADVYIVNTCTVTAEADRKSGQMIRRAVRSNRDAIVAAMGCSVEIQKGNSDAEIAVGTQNRIAVVQYVIERLKEKYDDNFFSYDPSDKDAQISYPLSDCHDKSQNEKSRAYIKIEDGCDLFCSYCIIPYARGRVKSRPAEEIIKEADILARNGYSEIVLTGIHLCSYGKDLGGNIEMLADLIESISELEHVSRIRLGSLEPRSLTEDFISRISRINKLCAHFHLSLQSGSEEVLKRMNRRYTTEQYREIVKLLRQYFPCCGLTTDIITAFPAETHKEHVESLAFCKDINFSAIHVFPYSERKGTKAEQISPKVSIPEIENRKKEFLELANELKTKYAECWVGRICEVIFEVQSGHLESGGYSREYVRVNFSGEMQLHAGQIYRVFIEKAEKGELFGKIV